MLSTLVEVQRLKRVERTGWTLRGLMPGAESVAAHSYGVAIVAMMLADELRARGVAVDAERVLRMALLHDLAEARVGDMPRTATEYFGAEARHGAERAAFGDIIRGVGAAEVELGYKQLHADYEERASLESRLVKAADIIDLLAQALAFERAGARGLDEFWEGLAERDFRLDGPAAEVVNDIFRQLIAERQKVLGKAD